MNHNRARQDRIELMVQSIQDQIDLGINRDENKRLKNFFELELLIEINKPDRRKNRSKRHAIQN